MSNPNNNKNFNDEALKINRQLKKDNDNLKAEIKSLWSDISELENLIKEIYKFLLDVDVQTAEEDRKIGKLQERIRIIYEEKNDG